LRVLIADDHQPTRLGIRQTLEADGFEVVAEVADGAAAVRIARHTSPDMCLLDINMPGSGIAAAAEITLAMPDTVVVMLTASRNDDDLFAALRAGASGYLLKDMDPDRLGNALRGVVAGEAALPRSLALKVIRHLQEPVRRRRLGRPAPTAPTGLTDREREVLELMAEDLSTEEIAARLFIGKVTVRTHVANVLRKLRVPDRKAAIALVRDRMD
jgi:two-component system NarL family response regulator